MGYGLVVLWVGNRGKVRFCWIRVRVRFGRFSVRVGWDYGLGLWVRVRVMGQS